MSKAKRIGTLAESNVVKYFQSLGIKNVTRKVLSGQNDLGDIHIGAVDSPSVIIEVKSRNKNCSHAVIQGFMNELKTEIINTYKQFYPDRGYLILKIPNKGKVEDWQLYKFINNEVWCTRVGDHDFSYLIDKELGLNGINGSNTNGGQYD